MDSGSGSDYGSDIDIDGEDEILRLLTTTPTTTTTLTTTIATASTITTATAATASTTATASGTPATATLAPHDESLPTQPDTHGGGADDDTVAPPDVSPSSSSPASQRSQYFDCLESPVAVEAESVEPPGVDPAAADAAAPPYDRFRSRKKALSVTDLVSGIWCEQQFEYSLVRGFRRRTPQMAEGSRMHKLLEDQVHDSVPVDVESAEDRWALKLFNVFQGLQALRRQGVTRELPVFGFLGGIFVQGVVDEISYLDPLSRASALSGGDDSSSGGSGDPPKKQRRRRSSVNGGDGNSKPAKQRRRTKKAAAAAPEAAAAAGPDVAELAVYSTAVPAAGGERIAYLSDTKTRQVRSLPSASQRRATAMQLMLYRRLLVRLRLGADADFARLLALFALDGKAKLSNAFVDQIALLVGGGDGDGDGLSRDALLSHNSLWGMWTLLGGQFGAAVGGVGGAMGVSYRLQADGSIIGFKTVAHDDAALDAHLAEALRWWRGERPAVGLEIEEAWKCQSCEFADECTWRLGKIQELADKNRRQRARAR